MDSFMLIIIIIAIIVVVLVLPNIRVVPQAKSYVIERLGSYFTTWGNGLHVKIPFIDRVFRIIFYYLGKWFTCKNTIY